MIHTPQRQAWMVEKAVKNKGFQQNVQPERAAEILGRIVMNKSPSAVTFKVLY